MWCDILWPQEEAEKSALQRIQEALLDGKPARSVALNDLEKDAVKHLCLLTMKPMIYVANVAETDLAEPDKNPYVEQVKGLSSDLQSGHVVVSAQVSHESFSVFFLMHAEALLELNLLFRLSLS